MSRPTIAASTGLIPSSAATPFLAPAGDWTAELGLLGAAGFRAIDLSDLWVALGELDAKDIDRLRAALDANGMTAVGASVIGVPLHIPEQAAEGRAWAEASIEVAARLGLPHVSLGLHPRPPRGRVPGARPGWVDAAPPEEESDEVYTRTADQLRALAERIADHGMTTSLEMHERTLLRNARTSLRLLEEIGRDDVGMNPDLGNLVRAPWELEETWFQTLQAIASRVTYWHVKNSQRVELPGGSAVGIATRLGDGIIDYRAGLAMLRDAGFTGAVVVEHYGGDSLGVAADAHDLLSRLITDLW